MSEQLFRKKSIDRVNSPENLNDFIKVANPGMWLILVTVIALLAGAFVWGIFGKIESSVSGVMTVSEGKVLVYTDGLNQSKLSKGQKVKGENIEAVITDVPNEPVVADDSFDGLVLYYGGFSRGDYLCCLYANGDIPDGTYEVSIITESIRPLSFVFN